MRQSGLKEQERQQVLVTAEAAGMDPDRNVQESDECDSRYAQPFCGGVGNTGKRKGQSTETDNYDQPEYDLSKLTYSEKLFPNIFMSYTS